MVCGTEWVRSAKPILHSRTFALSLRTLGWPQGCRVRVPLTALASTGLAARSAPQPTPGPQRPPPPPPFHGRPPGPRSGDTRCSPAPAAPVARTGGAGPLQLDGRPGAATARRDAAPRPRGRVPGGRWCVGRALRRGCCFGLRECTAACSVCSSFLCSGLRTGCACLGGVHFCLAGSRGLSLPGHARASRPARRKVSWIRANTQ